MEYAIDSGADGPRFRTKDFTQRVGPLAGEHRDDGADEVVYVLEGNGRASIGGEAHDLRPGVALFVARGTAWSAEGDARGVSVLVHEPEASSRARRPRPEGERARHGDRGPRVRARRDARVRLRVGDAVHRPRSRPAARPTTSTPTTR